MHRLQAHWPRRVVAGGIIVLATAVSVASNQNAPSNSDTTSLEAQIKTISSEAAGVLQQGVDRALGGPGSGGTRIIEWIDPSSLARMGSDTQRFLMARLQRPEFAAMKDYVALLFPRSPTADHLDPLLGSPAVSRPVAVEYSSAIAAFLKKIAGNPLAVTLNIITVPAEAEIDLRTAAVQGPRSRTNTTLSNVYRGLYKFRITKPLYKPADGTVNLVDDNRPHLECALALLDDARNESSCRRR